MENLINLLSNFNLENLITLSISLGIFLFFFLFRNLLSDIVIRIVLFKNKEIKNLRKVAFFNPLSIFFCVLGIYFSVLNFNISLNVNMIMGKFLRVSIIFLIAMGISNLVSIDSKIFKKIQSKMDLKRGNTILSFFIKILKVVIYLFAFVIIISELGYDINGLIAGLGLGGLTVALGAQDSAKNFFGGLVIIFDKTFVVGDWIQTKEIQGTVEEITFRSTRIRTFDNALVSVPNSNIVNDSIINWSQMQKRRVKMQILLTLDTPLIKLSNTISKIKLMLEEDAEVNKETILVNFESISDSGYNLLVYFFTNTTDYDKYLKIKENVNYKIVQIIESEKIELAYPTQTIYTKK